MSYRLNQRDEDDVRHWLGRDVRGDLGVRSSSSNFESRALLMPIRNNVPSHYYDIHEDGTTTRHGTDDVGLRCGPILVVPKKPAYVERDLGAELIATSKRDRLLQRIWQAVPAAHRHTLEAVYGGGRTFPAFEVFGELAPLVCDTLGAGAVHLRDKAAPTKFDAMVSFGERLRRKKWDQKGDQANERELDLSTDIETEADLRLSKACREYSAIADRAYSNDGEESHRELLQDIEAAFG